MSPLWIAGVMAAATAVVSAAAPRTVRLPADAGYADVTNAPYNAVPDGKSDCTAAIQKALLEANNVYLPAGTYLVSDTLHWGLKEGEAKRRILQGENRDKTVIRLVDKATNFDKLDRPREVIRMASRGDLNGPANAFRNALYDLTVDVGLENPAAIGVFFYAHNQGAMHNVRIVSRSPDTGYVGLDLFRGMTGPQLVKEVTVEGFEYGVRAGGSVRHIAFDGLYLKGQRRYGLYNDNNLLSIRKLRSDNTVPALHNRAEWGFVALTDAELVGGASESAAIENVNGYLYAANVRSKGYARAITSHGRDVEGSDVEEFVSREPFSQFASPRRSLRLPIEETPEVAWDDPKDWVSVKDFKPGENTYVDAKKKTQTFVDWSDALQAAIDSGATTIYLPPGSYAFGKTVTVRGKVKRIFGGEQRIHLLTGDKPLFHIVDGESDTVVIERFDQLWVYSTTRTQFLIDTPRTVVVRYLIGRGIQTTPRAGKVFLEDISAAPFDFKGGKIWAKQLNPEGGSVLVNVDNATLWLLGLKTEGEGPILHTINGGTTELLGGFIYGNGQVKHKPAFLIDNARASLVVGACSHHGVPFHEIVRETRGEESRTLAWEKTFLRDGWGFALPLYAGWSEPGKDLDPATPDVSRNRTVITDLVVKDDKPVRDPRHFRRERWSFHSNLVEGEMLTNHRQMIITQVPPELLGADYLRSNPDSYEGKKAGEVKFSFSVTEPAWVYAETGAPGWEKTNLTLRYAYSYNGWDDKNPAWARHDINTALLHRRLVKPGEKVDVDFWTLFLIAKPVGAAESVSLDARNQP